MIIDYSLPFITNQPVRYDITTGEAYDEFDIQELCHLKDSQVSQILSIFRGGKSKCHDKIGQIETLCLWEYKFYDENGKATILIPWPRTYKVVHPHPRKPNASRKQKSESAQKKTTRKEIGAPSLTPDNSSGDSSDSQPPTPELTSTKSGASKQKANQSTIFDAHLSS